MTVLVLKLEPLRPWETRTVSHPLKKNKGLFFPQVASPSFTFLSCTSQSTLPAALFQMVFTCNSGYWSSLSSAHCWSGGRGEKETEAHALSPKDSAQKWSVITSARVSLARTHHMTIAALNGTGWYNLSFRRRCLWEGIWDIWRGWSKTSWAMAKPFFPEPGTSSLCLQCSNDLKQWLIWQANWSSHDCIWLSD